METTRVELCKELYKLSGWDSKALPEGWYWYADDSSFAPFVGTRVLYDNTAKSVKATFIAPAYDLGYLLRKLHEAHPDVLIRLFLGGTNIHGETVHSTRIQQDPYHAEADTPENAAACLAIEMFKHGVLKRE